MSDLSAPTGSPSVLPNNSFGSVSLPLSASRGYQVYAGFWLRLVAYLIDFVFIYILSFIGGFILGFVIGFSLHFAGQDQAIRTVARIVGGTFGLVLGIVYFSAFLSGKWQATPGKKILGLYVMRADGRRISFLRGMGRYFAYMLSSLTLGIGFLMIAWTDEKKGLHDMVCDTRVVRGKPGLPHELIDTF